MRRVQEILSDGEDVAHETDTSAAVALKEKRLTFAWVDGEEQKVIKTFI